MSQHTPGPWYVGIDQVTVCGKTLKLGKEPTIAHCVELVNDRSIRRANDRSIRRANARLIAKAPEMLAILRRILKTYESFKAEPPGENLGTYFRTVEVANVRALLREIEEPG